MERWFSSGLGRPCRAMEGQSVSFRARSRSVLFSFVNGLGGVESLWICDQSLAVSWAGSLEGFGVERMREEARTDLLSGECARILSSFMERVELPESLAVNGLRYGELLFDPSVSLSPDADSILTQPPQRLDCRLSIEGVGEGRLSMLSV